MAGVTGGAKLDKAMGDMARRMRNPGTLRVGFLEGATYPDGTPVALVAAIQNFGAPARGIPPRPFFTNMIKAKSDGWGDSFARIMAQPNMTPKRALKIMGQGIEGQLRESIVATNTPPLAPATIARKGGTPTAAKPLIDTGHMFDSIDSEVV